ncbi:MAG: phospholipase [Tannerella sp.]|jgi:hypothetical protein|nr:phospholipase [Tannerella sp.]
MWYLAGGLVVLGIFAAAANVLSERKRLRSGEQEENIPDAKSMIVPAECCGLHEACERNSLPAAANSAAEYFDDEELDAYAGLPSDAYSEDAADKFREVLYTLKDTEAAEWIRSLQLRGIHLPDALKDEAWLIVGERRL